MTYDELADALVSSGTPNPNGTLAFLGFNSSSYSVRVAGTANYVWVRIADADERTPSQALNLAQVRLIPDTPVRVRYEDGILVVIGYDALRIDTFLSGTTLGATGVGSGSVDIVNSEQLTPGLVHAYSSGGSYSLTVQVEGFYYYDTSSKSLNYSASTTLDLTAYKPVTSGKHYYALVCFNTHSGSFAIHTGTEKSGSLALGRSDILSINIGSDMPLGAVELGESMTALDRAYYFVDVRNWMTKQAEPLTLYDPVETTLSSGAFTASGTYHVISSESGTEDELDTITAANDHSLILLQAASGHSITVTDAGNIALKHVIDVTIDDASSLLLFWNGTSWTDVGAGVGGDFGLLQVSTLGVLIGNDTSAWLWDTNGNMALVGDATVWRAINVSMGGLKAAGSKPPTFAPLQDDGAGSTGVYTYQFEINQEQETFFTVKLPLDWDEGSSFYPVIHWSPTDTSAGDVVWKIEYTWANVDEAFPTTSVISVTSSASETALMHQLAEFGEVPADDFENAAIVLCRLYRDVTNAADTYTSPAALLYFEAYYEVDKLGQYERP